jgi:hypothetical protein
VQPRLIILLLAFITLPSLAQEKLSRMKKLATVSDTLLLDTLSLQPGSIDVFAGAVKLDPADYRLLYKRNALLVSRKQLSAKGIPADTLTIFYKVFPLDFSREVYHKDIRQLQKDLSLAQNPFTIRYNTSQPAGNFLAPDGLNKNGSISRGISFGNNQDVVVNSNLNLQVSGKLTKDIELTLAATDNNIPIQPEGNSQQLQEFDKVFVQLNDRKSKLIVGDYQMTRPNSYFMNFYKRAQGLYFSNQYELGAGRVLRSTASGALSRGRFNRQVFRGVENNQGPYRLTGEENELFIVVLSGTERVYIDGRLLTRGQENDYIIDYNSAHITFTAKQLITKDKRITVEFQYSEKNYQRSIYFFNEEYQDKKLRVGLSYYSEQDNKNRSLQQTLGTADRQLLYDIGDTLSMAYTSGAVASPFNSIEVFYRKTDTLALSGTYKDIYVYTTEEAGDSVYRVRFSYTGLYKGNYVQVASAANGKVYKWVEPLAGVPQGAYEPVIPLITPKRRQMTTLSAEYKVNEHATIGGEGSFTKNDINTFSPHDKQNDDGQGARIFLTNRTNVGRSDSLKARRFLTYGGSYEYVQRNFAQIERFRGVEFFRDWNRNNDSIFNDQHIAAVSLGFAAPTYSTSYTGTNFTEGTGYQGFRHNLSGSLSTPGTRGFLNAAYLTTDNAPYKTEFYRHRSKVSQRGGKLLFTYLDEFEKNEFRYVPTDSLLRRSYQFWEWEGNISNADTSRNQYKIFYRERTDRFAYRDGLFNASLAQNAGFSAAIGSIRNHPFKTTFTYRKLMILDTTLLSIRPDQNLLSRVEYAPRLFKGFLQANAFYEAGYGLEQKKEYSYVQVAAGQGQYYWKDYNGDGIKQLNEFEVAQYTDQMIYIRVYTPTNSFVKSARDQFSLSVYLRPSVFRRENSGRLMDALARFVSQTAYRVDKKTFADNGQALRFNPFSVDISDTSLIATSYNLRQSVFFNQNSAVFGFDYTFLDNKSKQLLTNGFESRELQSHELHSRWNLSQAWSFFTTTTLGEKSAGSQFFSNRNYTIRFMEAEPRISYQPNTAFRISGVFKYSVKDNIALGGYQRATAEDYAIELKFNKLSKGSFNARADLVLIRYNDAENTPVSFEMLNALRPGQNITWTATYQQNLAGNIQISFNYDGRSAPGAKIIHIGGAQVRAFF